MKMKDELTKKASSASLDDLNKLHADISSKQPPYTSISPEQTLELIGVLESSYKELVSKWNTPPNPVDFMKIKDEFMKKASSMSYQQLYELFDEIYLGNPPYNSLSIYEKLELFNIIELLQKKLKPDLDKIKTSFENDIENKPKYKSISIDDQLISKNTVLPQVFKEKHANFLKSLTQRELDVLNLYTYSGDRVINQVLRGNVQDIKVDNPVFFKNLVTFLNRYNTVGRRGGDVRERVQQFETTNVGNIRTFVNEFMNVIKKCPTLDERMFVYRGVNRQQDIHTHGNEILSTSYESNVAKDFIRDNPCCFLTILLKPGIKCIWIEPISDFKNEHEIIVVPPFTFPYEPLLLDPEQATVPNINNYLISLEPPSFKRAGRKTYKKKRRNIRRNKTSKK